MIVFDLKCAHGHVFEAWFGSSSDFEVQKARGLVSCPLCGASEVDKAPMAANIPAKGNKVEPSAIPVASEASPTAAEAKAMLAKLAKMQAEVLKDSTWVGRDFASQARAMDAGETDKASIHGEVSPAEAKSLIEDGIGVLPLPFPVVPPEKQN